MALLSQQQAGMLSKASQKGAWVVRLALAALMATLGWVRAQSSREDQLKGVLLFNLIQFVEWPPSAFSDPHEPITIAVYASDSFADLLDQIVANETVNQRPVRVVRYRSWRSVEPGHILYVGADRGSRVEEVLARVRGRPVLTVSDAPRFIHEGGMIRFYRNHEDKIRVQIHVEAARSNQLNLSAKLLRVAELVEPVSPGAQ